ncbi:MAG: hypothetical protein AB7U35_10345 [Sphingobium sp.]
MTGKGEASASLSVGRRVQVVLLAQRINPVIFHCLNRALAFAFARKGHKKGEGRNASGKENRPVNHFAAMMCQENNNELRDLLTFMVNPQQLPQ